MPVNPSDILALRPTIMDYNQLQAAFQQKQQEQALQGLALFSKANGVGQQPAALQLTNEYERRLKAGDTDGANHLVQFSKILDHGVVVGPDGQAVQMAGYAPAVAGIQGAISGAKEMAQKQVDIRANPIIAGGEANARNASELRFANPIATAKETGTKNAAAQADVNKQAVQSGNTEAIINNILSKDSNGKDILDYASGSTLAPIGNAANQMLGRSTPTTQANSKLVIYGGQLLNAVPRMEGPQSDADVRNYKEQAGKVADPTVPAGDKRAALDIMSGIAKKYAVRNQGTVQPIDPSVMSGTSALPDLGPASPGLHMDDNSPNVVSPATSTALGVQTAAAPSVNWVIKNGKLVRQ